MTTKLEISNNKLMRLKNELNRATENAFSHMKLANGQPMNDKRGGHIFLNKSKQLEDKAISMLKEIEKQEERVSKLERQQWNKENGRTNNGGIKTSVENIDQLKERIREREEKIKSGNVHVYSKRYLYKDKKKLQLLLTLKEKAEARDSHMSKKTRNLIESGEVIQWSKKPIYYFVKGLKKVALVINEQGDFVVSKKYPATSEIDKDFISKLTNDKEDRQ